MSEVENCSTLKFNNVAINLPSTNRKFGKDSQGKNSISSKRFKRYLA